LTEDQLEWVTHLGLSLPYLVSDDDLERARSILQVIQDEGMNPREMYEWAVKLRDENWPPMPPYETIAPSPPEKPAA